MKEIGGVDIPETLTSFTSNDSSKADASSEPQS